MDRIIAVCVPANTDGGGEHYLVHLEGPNELVKVGLTNEEAVKLLFILKDTEEQKRIIREIRKAEIIKDHILYKAKRAPNNEFFPDLQKYKD